VEKRGKTRASSQGSCFFVRTESKTIERQKTMPMEHTHGFALIINVVLPTNRPLSVASAMKCVPKELQNAEKYPFFIVPDLRRKSRARHQWQAVPQKAAK